MEPIAAESPHARQSTGPAARAGEARATDHRRSALLARVPAGFFAMAAGLFALGSAWRAASSLWGVSPVVGELVMVLATLAWLLVGTLYAAKWIWARNAARAEWRHPVQCCFIALAPVTTLLAALAARPHAPRLADTLYAVGLAALVAFMVDRVATLWAGGRDALTTTPLLYLPTVAGGFVSAIVSSALGHPTIATLAFGAGLFSWVALESVVLHRLLVQAPLESRLLPTLGVQLAPPAVGCVSYLSLTTGAPDRFALMLLGYGLLQAFVLLRLAPRFRVEPFAASFWSFSFGSAALALASIRIAARSAVTDAQGGLVTLAVVVFAAANVLIGVVLVRTLLLAMRGQLLPVATGSASAVHRTAQ